MIQKLQHKIILKDSEMGLYNISSSSPFPPQRYREPTKKELIDKINEVVSFLNGKSN